MATLNDVMDYSKFYSGVNESPRFYHEHFEYEELKTKLFVPIDDFNLGQKLCENTNHDIILHHFAHDKKQNRLIVNNFADKELHKKAFAVTSPDFSADSNNCWSCFNEGNILKSRICAYRWQSELDEPVILTLLWGDESTYKWAFGNVEKGSVVAVSSQAVKDEQTFEKGIRTGIDMIQPESICWLGPIFNFMKKYYYLNKIIKMQTRTELLQLYYRRLKEKSDKALELFPA